MPSNICAPFDAFGLGITKESEWRGQLQLEHLLYVDNAQYTGYQKIYAVDDFNSGAISGGRGWTGSWNLNGAASITTSGTPNGSHHLQLTGNTGSATRAVNLSGVTDAN